MVATHSAAAQGGRWGVGGGLVAPTGEYSTHDKSGWHADVAYTPTRFPNSRLDLRLDALYGQTPRKTVGYTSSRLFGLGANLELHTVAGSAYPYLLGGLGYYELEEGNAGGPAAQPVKGWALGGGGGLALKAGRVRAFVEARFIAGPAQNGVNFIPVTLGVSFGE